MASITHAFKRTVNPMAIVDIERHAPSVFTKGHADTLSERYAGISTADLLPPLLDQGFGVFGARQGTARRPDGSLFARHQLILRHRNANTPVLGALGGIVPEIHVTNSHDGSSAWSVSLGMFRQICFNGLVVGSEFAEFRLRHVGANIVDRCGRATGELWSQTGMVVDQMMRMAGRTVDQSLVRAYSLLAYATRYPHEDVASEILGESSHRGGWDIQRMNRAWRHADVPQTDNVWSLFNRVQENFMAGTRRRSRAITSISRDMSSNQLLWAAAADIVDRPNANGPTMIAEWQRQNLLPEPAAPKQLELVV